MRSGAEGFAMSRNRAWLAAAALLAGGCALGGCGRGGSDADLVAKVVAAYNAPASAVARHLPVHELPRARYAGLAAALEQIINENAGAPAATLDRVRELHALCAQAATLYATAAEHARTGRDASAAWNQATRLRDQFEAGLRALPGAAEALGPYDAGPGDDQAGGG